MTNVIITMAGFGSRFRDAGYNIPKYCISVHGRTLFYWSLLSLKSMIDAGYNFVFIVRKADNAVDFIDVEARRLGIRSFQIVPLDAPTDGQATTALLAGSVIQDEFQPIVIYNIDTLVFPGDLSVEHARGDGWIPCFDAQGSHWSFVRLGAEGRAIEVREKVRISSHATIGLYWFSSFALYRSAYDAFYADNRNIEMNEKYIAPLYNYLISSGLEVYISEVPHSHVIPLGIPEDVASFAEQDIDEIGLQS